MKKTAWKDNNMLLRESTPVEQRDDLAKWQKEYDREEAMDMESKKDRKVAELLQEIENMCKDLERGRSSFTHLWTNFNTDLPSVIANNFVDRREISLMNVALMVSMSQLTFGDYLNDFEFDGEGYDEDDLEGFDADMKLITLVEPQFKLMFFNSGKLDRARAGKIKALVNLWNKKEDRDYNWSDAAFDESPDTFNATFRFCVANFKGLKELHTRIANLIANFNKILYY